MNTEATPNVQADWEKYNKYLDDSYAKWSNKTNLLDGIPEAQAKIVAAVLDNERLFLDTSSVGGQFRKLGFAVTQKVFGNFLGFDMVAVQPLFEPQTNIFYYKYKAHNTETNFEVKLELASHSIKAMTKKMRPAARNLNDYEDPALVDDLAREIHEEIVREIATDLRNNAGTLATKHISKDGFDGEQIYINLVEISGVIHRKTLRSGLKWIVTGPEIAKALCKLAHIELGELSTIKKVGTICGVWKLIVDPLYPANEILCGGFDEMLDGYVYSPYIFISPTPVVLDPESFCPRHGFLHRYGKYLVSPKPYGRLKYVISDNDATPEAK